MKKLKYIGICGKMGSGKTISGDILVENSFADENKAFATAVKECAEEYFGLPMSERTYASRLVWQGIGHGFRKINESTFGNEDIWVNYLFRKTEDQSGKTFVISDVRYPNEALEILNRDGILIYLDVPSELRKQRIEERDDRVIPDEEWKKINLDHSELFAEKASFYSYGFINRREHQILYMHQERNDLENHKQELINRMQEKITTIANSVNQNTIKKISLGNKYVV